jgi:hypothetical protein
MKHLKIFEEYISPEDCIFSDASRLDAMQEVLDSIENGDYDNVDEPEYDWLLDPYDGYEKQTYIQYNPDEGIITYWEGWSKLCWDALFNKKGYNGLSKEEATKNVVENRIIPSIKNEFKNLELIEYKNFWHETWDDDIEDGWITKIDFKIIA